MKKDVVYKAKWQNIFFLLYFIASDNNKQSIWAFLLLDHPDHSTYKFEEQLLLLVDKIENLFI